MRRVAALALVFAAFVVGAGAQDRGPNVPGAPATDTGHHMGPNGSMPMGPNGSMPMGPNGSMPMGPNGSMPMHHGMAGMMAHAPGQQSTMPSQAGQAAFGAIQEIVAILLADPTTNWSKVNIDALRQHLIDMDEVTIRAAVHDEPIENGLRMTVTGEGRTLAAIQRMVPAHAQDIDGTWGWTVRARQFDNGDELTVTSANAADVAKIRALGFMGIMALGTHQMHHLMMAKGEFMH